MLVRAIFGSLFPVVDIDGHQWEHPAYRAYRLSHPDLQGPADLQPLLSVGGPRCGGTLCLVVRRLSGAAAGALHGRECGGGAGHHAAQGEHLRAAGAGVGIWAVNRAVAFGVANGVSSYYE